MIDRKLYSEYLMHYGTKRRSGRYPWGSGENPYQHEKDFMSRVQAWREEGKTDKQIADIISDDMGLEGEYRLSSGDVRSYYGIANDNRKLYLYKQIDTMTEDGLGDTEIARRLGLANESTVRGMRNEKARERAAKVRNTVEFVKEQVDKKGPIDIGKGSEVYLNLSETKMDQVRTALDSEGYRIYGIGQPYATNTGNQITMEVVCPPGMTYKDAYKARDEGNIHLLTDYTSTDGGLTFKKTSDILRYPASLDSKRLMVRYADDKESGLDKDGVIELRKGPKDISLEGSSYAQVRILVDGTHYLKGMAVYSDDMPPGVDVIFNTSKKRGTPLKGETSDTSVLKPIYDKEGKLKSGDPNNPFGTYIKPFGGQYTYIDKNGEEKLGVINKVYEEGDWDTWSRTLPSQFLSKQPRKLVKNQLNETYADRVLQFEEIKSINNPTIRKKQLYDFAEDCDKSAVHLKAAGLPGQSAKVILPVTTISDKEIYAPTYQTGQKVALIRYPHQGIFEIPILTVNNNHPGGKKVIGPLSEDCVGINPKTAAQLSGADFDGDTVTVIPVNNRVEIKTEPYLKELEGFNAREAYPKRKGMAVMKNTDVEMGKITNLIQDMTIQGASNKEIARAVKHAYVVIDAEKHGLDYQKSYIDNNIQGLKNRYQAQVDPVTGKVHYPAATLITRSQNEVRVPYKRKGNPNINPETGEKSWEAMTFTDPKTGKQRTLPSKQYVSQHPERKKDAEGNWYETGKTITVTTKSTQMKETNDARTLSSGTAIENYYADYANKMKAMANEARKEAYMTPRLEYNKEARNKYAAEVASLEDKYNIAKKNLPLERKANNLATSRINKILEDNPELKTKDKKEKMGKLRNQEINRARAEVGADSKGSKIVFTDREWEAIQAGAVSDSRLNLYLQKADPDRVKELSMPKTQHQMTPAKIAKIQAMKASGYTIEQIAQGIGMSSSTVSKYLKENR